MNNINDLAINATTAFSNHIEDGTVTIFNYGDLMEVNGGNWSIGVTTDHVWCNVPHNDPDTMSDDVEEFIDNIFSTEAIESLRNWNRRSWNIIADGLRDTDENWSVTLANRIT